MIVTPLRWSLVGRPVSLERLERVLCDGLLKTECLNLALSGGVDSTLLLALMVKVFGPSGIRCFNVAGSTDHPDYEFSEIAARHYKVSICHFNPEEFERKADDSPGDEIVRGFYNWFRASGGISVVAGDGVDEFNAGYYAHLQSPNEAVYYDFLRRLQEEHLIPLDLNSVGVNVHLPYISDEAVSLWSQIPLFDKLDGGRKQIITKLAESNQVPSGIINRRKYGFVDALTVKD